MSTGNCAIVNHKYYWCHLSDGVWSDGYIEREHRVECSWSKQTSISDGGTAIRNVEEYYNGLATRKEIGE